MTDKVSMVLPEAFQEKMRKLLGEEYEAFMASYEKNRVQGLRFNGWKTDLETVAGEMPEEYGLQKIPWVQEGYYYDEGARPGRSPLHEAGVYYIQEPSAMAVVEFLDPRPGDQVLDLCGAPGGKSTHIASRLCGSGLLVSNEIHPARARILAQNVERMGIANAVVTNEDSEKLTWYFPEFFDKIVVDAPCSGEGMFRKDENARTEWSPDHVILCAARQAEILDNAAKMLKGGGRMVYSTCTFSPEENEGSIQAFLNRHPEFSIEQVSAYEGFGPGHPEWAEGGCEDLRHTFRIWPHKVEGEGHYLAVLKKAGMPAAIKRNYPVAAPGVRKLYEKDLALAVASQEGAVKHPVLFGDQVYGLPEGMVEYGGLKILRAGLHLGTVKKNRFEPSHALALHLKKEQAVQWYELKSEAEAERYLRGETLEVEELPLAGGPAGALLMRNGWVLILVDGYSLGWAKLVGRTLKNHYPKGLRRP